MSLTNAALIDVQYPVNNVVFSFTFDASISSTLIISFMDSAGNLFSSSFNYTAFDPVNFNNLTYTVTPDCGLGTGTLDFDLPGLSDVSVFWFPAGGVFDPNLLAISGLPDQTMIVFVLDNLCGTSLIFDISNPILIPNGELSYTIDQVTPISICTSQTVQVSGMMEGTVQLSATGGSGFYEYSFDNAGGAQVLPLGIYTGIDVAGTYEFDVIDLVSGCTLIDAPYTIPENEVDLDIVVTELQPMIDNGAIVLQTATLEVETTFSDNGLYSLEYEWMPNGFLNDNNGIYSEIDAEGTYTVHVDINGGVCQASTTFDVVSTLCELEGDVNLDGFVNGADLLSILGSFDTFCEFEVPCPADVNYDGIVNQQDMLAILPTYGLSWQAVCLGNSN